MKAKITAGVIAALTFVVGVPALAFAQSANVDFTQSINPGVLSTDFRNASNVVVGAPSFGLNAASVSLSQQTVTGTFGTNTQRISVNNPGAANNGWSLAIAATGGATATWTAGSNTYKFNGTAAEGRLTLDPSVAALSVSSPATSTGISLGTQAAFASSTPVSLLTAASGSDDVWSGYITDVGVSQTVPASQPAGSYTFSLTQTVTAL